MSEHVYKKIEVVGSSKDSMDDAIRNAIEDQTLRRSLTDRGHLLVRSYGWPGVAERAFDLLGTVAA